MTLIDRLYEYYLLMRMDRPIGTFLLLWPALWALWVAGAGRPQALVLAVFILGVFLMRSAGCVVNDLADRQFDPHVARTRERPIAAGRVSPREAVALFVVLCFAALALVLLLNRLTVLLSFVAVVLAASYPFMKRYTHLPQFYLGLAFGWSVPMAFAAQTGAVPAVAWVLMFANMFWAVAYDTMYAMVDREDDLAVGIKSTAILFGRYDRLMVGIMQALTLALLLVVGWTQALGPYYYAMLAVAAVLAVYQQALIRRREADKCLRAFLNNAWFGAAVFVGMVLHYLDSGAAAPV